jgi:Holliday junction DNA helicase RuvA
MISYLEGKVIASDERSLIIQAGTLGWRVFCGETTLAKVRKNEERASLFTHLHSREDLQELYGFLSYNELRLFELLLTVSGVGPRSAQLIIDSLSAETVVGAIQAKKSEVFTSVSGIGAKLSQKIIIDLEPRLKLLGLTAGTLPQSFEEERDAIDALRSLGYSRNEAKAALEKVSEETHGVSQRVEEALKVLGRGRHG